MCCVIGIVANEMRWEEGGGGGGVDLYYNPNIFLITGTSSRLLYMSYKTRPIASRDGPARKTASPKLNLPPSFAEDYEASSSYRTPSWSAVRGRLQTILEKITSF